MVQNEMRSGIHVALLLAALCLPYTIRLGSYSLWDTNEAFYAETPREMLESGDYVAPRFNYQARTQKPPLTYWTVLLGYKLAGVDEWAVRLPGALAALGALIYTFRIGSLLFGRGAGLMAAAILATTARFFVLAKRLPIDILLVFFLTATAYHIMKSLKERSTAAWLFACLFAGLGFLTKGPIALVIPAASLLLALLWTRQLPLPRRWLLIALLVPAAVVLPWYIAIFRRHGWSYIAEFFLRDNLGRFAGESLGPARGALFYVGVFLADYFPWSPLGLAALYGFYAARRSHPALRAAPYALAVTWILFVFILFSLSQNKQEYYIAPIYPLLSVLIAGLIQNPPVLPAATGRIIRQQPWKWAFLVASLGLLAASAFSIYAVPEVFPGLTTAAVYLPALLLFLASLAPLAIAWRGSFAAGATVMAIPVLGLYLLAAALYLPAAEPLRPVKQICRGIAAQATVTDAVGYYRLSVPSMVFYLRRPIFEEFDADAMVRRFQRKERVFCVLTERDHNYFVGDRDLVLYILDRRPRLAGSLRAIMDRAEGAAQEMLLVSNRPSRQSRDLPGAAQP